MYGVICMCRLLSTIQNMAKVEVNLVYYGDFMHLLVSIISLYIQ